MKKQLAILMSLLLGVTGTATLTGCATAGARTEPYSRVAKPKQTRAGENEFMIHAYTCLVHLNKRSPREAVVGQTVLYEMELHAEENSADVVVTDTIPDGASYVRSEPEAKVDGKQLTWRFNTIDKGAIVPIKLWVKAEREGRLVNCAKVVATPYGCVATLVGKPSLTIAKSGPARARIGTEVAYNIVVRNTGSSAARNVVVTDTVPDGLTHVSGRRTLTYDIGDLAPNASKEISVAFRTAQRGRVCNVATVRSQTVSDVSADACTVIVEPMLEIAKSGMKEQFIGKAASYDIVVSNPGDTSLTGLVVTDTAPAATRISSARGATVTGNTAVWRIAELRAGDKQTFTLELKSATPGNHCNSVAVTSAEGLTANSSACTLWRGVAGVLLELIDTTDPILVGDTTTYQIRVTNQGTAPDSNINITVRFPRELTPMTATGATLGRVDGQTVTFAPVASLAPKQSVEFAVTARGAAAGDARVTLEMKSATADTTVTEVESTHVY